MSTNLQASTFLPGGIVSKDQLELAAPYIFVITLASLILIFIIILIIREILKSHGIFRGCCECKINCIQCSSCLECCAACAQACDCCGTTSIDACFDKCCPKRRSFDIADLLTCSACCHCQCCACGNTVCVCAPTDITVINCLCCACEPAYPERDNDER